MIRPRELRNDAVMMRRQIIMAIAAFAAIFDPAFGADAPMFRGDLDHTGIYLSAPVVHPARVKWKFHTGGYVNSSPAVVQGVVYVGSADGTMYALDEGSGKALWRFRTGSRVVSSPAVSAGVVYFGSYDGNFYAVNTADGKLLWKFKTQGERRFEGTHLHG